MRDPLNFKDRVYTEYSIDQSVPGGGGGGGGEVLPISSDVTGIIKGFVLGSKFSIPEFFWIGKLIWKGFFWGGLILFFCVRVFKTI